MNTVAKILIVVNLVLAGGFLASAGTFLGKQDLWKRKFEAKVVEMKTELDLRESTIKDLRARVASVQEQSNKIQADLAAAEERERQASARAETMTEAFDQASTQLTNLTAASEQMVNTISANRDLIDTLQRERGELITAKEVALDAKEAAVRNLAEKELQFESLMSNKQTLESRIEDLQNQLRSAQLTAENATLRLGSGADIAMDQPHHAGKVLDVDNTANVVVISLGSEDEVRVGFKYTVSRGSQYVGMIEITDVQSKQSAGRSITSLQKSPIQRGDRVMSR